MIEETVVDADDIALILAEEARVEHGELQNVSYLAVKIAEVIERRLTTEMKRLRDLERFPSEYSAQMDIFKRLHAIDDVRPQLLAVMDHVGDINK